MDIGTGQKVEEVIAPIKTGRVARIAGLLSNIVVLVLLLAFLTGIGGFFVFWSDVSSIPRPDNPKADAIIVLTGGYKRINQAVSLLTSGAGKRLLISGVNPATSRAQIRRFTKSTKDLFDCCVDTGYQALDTMGNAAEAVGWIRANGFKSVIVVTDNYHLPRSLIELKRLDQDTIYISYPVQSAGPTFGNIAANPYMLLTLTSEYLKTLEAGLRDWLPLNVN